MSIQKKSLISTLKSAKKANVVKEDVTAVRRDGEPGTRCAAPAMQLTSERRPRRC